MHKNFAKAVAGSLLAATVLATSLTTVVVPMSVNAGQLLGQTDFEDGTGLPWHTCETNPAKQTFEIEDGKYIVHIVESNGSDGRWDLQFRHRGLQLVEGHTYEVKAEITADADGYVYSKIGNYSGDKEYWHDLGAGEWTPYPIKKGETLKIDTTFTASGVEEGPAEWAFHYANNNGKYNNFDTGMPNGSSLTFDNLSLIDKNGNENDFDPKNEFGVVRPRTNVRTNQLGYYTGLTKKASYVTDASTPLEYEIRDSSGKAVYTGKASEVKENDTDSGTPETQQVEVTVDGSGTTETRTKYKDSGKYVQVLDFSDFQTAGTGYKIFVKDTVGVTGTQSGIQEAAYDTTVDGDKIMWENWKTGVSYVMNESHEFDISATVYEGLINDAFNYYYQNRSGVPIEEKYITSGNKAELAHSEYGHNPDTAYVQPKWVKAYGNASELDKSYSITATGGWYDAGDHGKYVVNGGVSIWTLQNMYEMSKKLGTDDKWLDKMAIPENTNKAPDALDEAKIELDFMFDMMVKSDDPYWGSKCENMVYHKLHDYKWTGLAIHAWEYEGFTNIMKEGRIVKPPTYAATLNMVACAAQASRLWEDYDSEYAKTCLENAKKGYEAVKNSGDGWQAASGNADTDPQFAPLDQAIGGGAYGDTYVYDDFYWAACELYITTGDETYYNDLMKYNNPNDSTGKDKALSLTSNLGGGENKGSFSSFNWGCTSGLGTLSLYLNSDKLSEGDATTVKSSIESAADNYIAEEDKQGMGIPYHGSTFTDPINIGDETVTGYEWGSNSFVINNAIVMAYAYDSTDDVKYLNGASTALDYIFGRNGLDFSYVSGYGDVTLQYPHHRLWANGVDPSFPKAPNGLLSGGPGAGMQDPYIGGLGFKRGTLASQKCYVDSAEAWSVNEITINWNAPLCWMVSYMDDVAALDGEKPTKPSEEATTKPDETTQPSTEGDTEGTTAAATVAPTIPPEEVQGLLGDADVDTDVDVADVVKILSYTADKEGSPLTGQGLYNADCYDRSQNAEEWGTNATDKPWDINSSDASAVAKFVAKNLSALPETWAE